MRKLALGFVVWCVMGAVAVAATPDPQLMVPIQKFIDSFNKGDSAAAEAATRHAATSTRPARGASG